MWSSLQDIKRRVRTLASFVKAVSPACGVGGPRTVSTLHAHLYVLTSDSLGELIALYLLLWMKHFSGSPEE